MRRYGRVEFLSVVIMGLMLAAVLYATAGCSERKGDRITNVYEAAPDDPAVPDTAFVPAPHCPCKHCKRKRHK
jgi:hypothetical protein